MALIVFEGPEGVGKTTQAALLAERLAKSGRVVSLREPGGTALGNEIRRVLLDPASELSAQAECLLFMASRAQLVEREIRPALTSGTVVVLDRFFLSTYAYQVAGRGLPEDLVASANRLATGGLRPDLTLLLTLPDGDGLARASRRGPQDRMERADTEFHQRVTRAFAEFATPAWQRAHPEAGPIVAVDSRGSVDAVHDSVRQAVAANLSGLK